MWAVALPEQLVNSAWLIKKISVERVVKVNHIYIYIYIALIK